MVKWRSRLVDAEGHAGPRTIRNREHPGDVVKNCPHCQFLVADGATTCSVCHSDLSSPPDPTAAGSPPFVAPGQVPGAPVSSQPSFTAAPYGAPTATLPPSPGTAWPAPPPGAPFPPTGVGAQPKRGWSATKILVVVGLVCLVPVLGVAGLVLLGVTADVQLTTGELAADELPWASHDDPGGWYVVDMPGRVVVDTVEMPEGYGIVASVETASVSAREFAASVTRSPDVVPAGQTFTTAPYSITAAERGLSEAGILDDAEIVDHQVVVGTGDLQMLVEAHGTVRGEQSVMWSRLVIVGTDLYELNAVGSLDDSEEIAAIVERMATSFSPG